MLVISEFFSDLIADTKLAAQPFLRALVYISQYYGWSAVEETMDTRQSITINNYQHFPNQIKLLLSPVQLTKEDRPFLPLLLISSQHEYYVLTQNKYGREEYYSVTENKRITAADWQQLDIIQAWQCLPTGLPVYCGIDKLLQGLCCYASQRMTTLVLPALLAACLSLAATMGGGYLITNLSITESRPVFTLCAGFICSFGIMCAMTCLYESRIKNLTIYWLLCSLPSLWRRVFSLSAPCLAKYESGRLAQTLFDYEAAMTAIPKAVMSLLFAMMALLILFGFMAYINLMLACLFLLIAILVIGFKLFFLRGNVRHQNLALHEQSIFLQQMQESLLQIHKIRSSGVEEYFHRRLMLQLIKTKIHTEQVMLFDMPSLLLDAALPVILMLGIYLMVYWQSIPQNTGLLLQFILFTGQFSTVFNKFSANLFLLIQQHPNLARIKWLAEEEPEVCHPPASTITTLTGEIQFKHVSLHRPHQAGYILQDIQLHIPAGKMTAIVGQSGSGKSTLVKLLLGLMTPDSGTIFIDHQPLAAYQLSHLREKIGVILQTTQLFPGSIYSNLTLHAPLSVEEAWQLLHQVDLAQDVASMPMQLHTYISDNPGESLSGGQRQKLLLARTLSAKPAILILDEATSALDSNSQAVIFDFLDSLKITRIIIAHRMSTITRADKIYEIKEGRLCGERSLSCQRRDKLANEYGRL